jgi:catechol 2,3-dioxygenase-like lactoylglutathione lyase family enzyme
MSGFAIDHVQIAIPLGGEDAGRRFFGGLLGLDEIPKPAAMAARGGCWFDLGGGVQIHLGAEAGFRPARKAHMGLGTPRLEEVRTRLRDAGYETHDDVPIDGRARFFTHDPFGNRIEFLERPR